MNTFASGGGHPTTLTDSNLDDPNRASIRWTDFSSGPVTTVLGENLSRRQILETYESLLRNQSPGQFPSQQWRLQDVPFPGYPGQIGISVSRVLDHAGHPCCAAWTDVCSTRELDFRSGRKCHFPLMIEKLHALPDGTYSTSICRGTPWKGREVIDNVMTGKGGFRDLNIVAARIWADPGDDAGLELLKQSYDSSLHDAFEKAPWRPNKDPLSYPNADRHQQASQQAGSTWMGTTPLYQQQPSFYPPFSGYPMDQNSYHATGYGGFPEYSVPAETTPWDASTGSHYYAERGAYSSDHLVPLQPAPMVVNGSTAQYPPHTTPESG